jgi:hypothetical protein
MGKGSYNCGRENTIEPYDMWTQPSVFSAIRPGLVENDIRPSKRLSLRLPVALYASARFAVPVWKSGHGALHRQRLRRPTRYRDPPHLADEITYGMAAGAASLSICAWREK